MKNRNNAIFPWWYWVWLVHILFVGSMYLYMFTPYKTDWFKMIFSSISLGHEMNYAVWWSGIFLLIASHLFYRASSEESERGRAWQWIVLSLGLLALAFDEIGSLHEIVSKYMGWKGLAPFALIFICGFGMALFGMFKQPGYRIPGVLILIGMALFASVASLEFVEHNMRLDKFQQRSRLIIEEGVELFAMSLIVISGLIVLRRAGVVNRKLSEIIGNTNKLLFHPLCMYAFFAIHFIAVAAFAIPNSGLFSEGNPASVFPVFLYYILSMICISLGREHNNRLLWWGFAMVFLFTSLCQIHSLTELMNKLLIDFDWFKYPPNNWYITLVPVLALSIVFAAKGWVSAKTLVPDLILVFCISVVLYSDRHSLMVYYLFSSCTAFLCYRLISNHIQRDQ